MSRSVPLPAGQLPVPRGWTAGPLRSPGTARCHGVRPTPLYPAVTRGERSRPLRGVPGDAGTGHGSAAWLLGGTRCPHPGLGRGMAPLGVMLAGRRQGCWLQAGCPPLPGSVNPVGGSRARREWVSVGPWRDGGCRRGAARCLRLLAGSAGQAAAAEPICRWLNIARQRLGGSCPQEPAPAASRAAASPVPGGQGRPSAGPTKPPAQVGSSGTSLSPANSGLGQGLPCPLPVAELPSGQQAEGLWGCGAWQLQARAGLRSWRWPRAGAGFGFAAPQELSPIQGCWGSPGGGLSPVCWGQGSWLSPAAPGDAPAHPAWLPQGCGKDPSRASRSPRHFPVSHHAKDNDQSLCRRLCRGRGAGPRRLPSPCSKCLFSSHFCTLPLATLLLPGCGRHSAGAGGTGEGFIL